MSDKTLPGQKMWDDEITGQLATFMFAGSETTS
jgi:cytochrome P450